jgi:DNA sulfur modification protein DndD
MISLKRLQISNFRNIKSIDISFSNSVEKPLTVIRAKNGVGKTTLLLALRWALFGDLAAPGAGGRRRKLFPKAPASWDTITKGDEVPVRVELDLVVHEGDEEVEYQIVRQQSVRVDGDTRVEQDLEMIVDVWQKTAAGSKQVSHPELVIKTKIMSANLMEFFFIDGDDAYSFVAETDSSERSEKVEDAVKQMLQLEILESAIKHLKESKKNVGKKIADLGEGSALEKITSDLAAANYSLEVLETKIEEHLLEVKTSKSEQSDLEKIRDTILSSGGGDKDSLKRDLDAAERSVKDQDSQIERLQLELRDRINSADLLFSLTNAVIRGGFRHFTELRKNKKIPNTLHEILELALSKKECICGADVSPGTAGHDHLSASLDLTKEQTPAHVALMNLAQIAEIRLRTGVSGNSKWLKETEQKYQELVSARKKLLDARKDLATLEERIRVTPDNNLAAIQDGIEIHRKAVEDGQKQIGGFESEKRRQLEIVGRLEAEREKLTKAQSKFRAARAEMLAVNSMLDVFERTLETFETEKKSQVSTLMNEYFLRMIAQDPEDGEYSDYPIKSVELTDTFDIQATLGLGSVAPPSQLNGASRRALTVAYLLALAEVSGEESVLVMDTPLGMTSDDIRQAFVSVLLSKARQSTLIMTPNEMQGIEEVLRQYSGVSWELVFDDDKTTVSKELISF